MFCMYSFVLFVLVKRTLISLFSCTNKYKVGLVQAFGFFPVETNFITLDIILRMFFFFLYFLSLDNIQWYEKVWAAQ